MLSHQFPEQETHVHTTQEILDLAMKAQGISSDYKLGLMLETSPGAVCNWRKGRSHPDDHFAAKLAELANWDKGYFIACIHAQRAKEGSSVHAIWLDMISRLRSSGTPLAILAFVALSASALTGQSDAVLSAGLYIMSTCIRGLLDRLTPGRSSPAGASLLVTL